MASIGTKLRQAREEKGYSLEDVRNAIKIQTNFLQAMEEDKFEEILSPAYRKIFLDKYAAFLELDSKAILREYHGVYPERTKVKIRLEEEDEKLKKIEVPIVPKTTARAISVVLVLFIVAGGLFVVSKIRNPGKTASSGTAAQQRQPQAKPAALLVPKNQQLRLSITAKDDAWLRILQDGKLIFQNTLKKGSSKKVTAVAKIEIWTGKAEAVFLSLNGKYLGPAGKGVVKDIVITHEGIKK